MRVDLDPTIINNSKASPTEKLQATARMLEGLFVKQLMTAMRKTVHESEFSGSGLGKDTYQEMMDGALSDELAKTGSFGLADTLCAQLDPQNFKPSDIGPSGSGRMISHSIRQPTEGLRVPQGQLLNGVGFVPPERPNRDNDMPLNDNDARFGVPVAGQWQWVGDQPTVTTTAQAAVLSMRSGTVVEATDSHVTVQGSDGVRVRYEGLGQVMAQVGDLVLKGQIVGQVGTKNAFDIRADRRGTAMQPHEIQSLLGK